MPNERSRDDETVSWSFQSGTAGSKNERLRQILRNIVKSNGVSLSEDTQTIQNDQKDTAIKATDLLSQLQSTTT